MDVPQTAAGSLPLLTICSAHFSISSPAIVVPTTPEYQLLNVPSFADVMTSFVPLSRASHQTG